MRESWQDSVDLQPAGAPVRIRPECPAKHETTGTGALKRAAKLFIHRTKVKRESLFPIDRLNVPRGC